MLPSRAWNIVRSSTSFAKRFSTSSSMAGPLRIGYVPEHFSTPLHFAQKHHGLKADLLPFPSGTGHMVQSLQAAEIDIGIGLTEGWVNGLAKLKHDADYRIVGSYVKTPLCWAISTGAQRNVDVAALRSSGKVGISRYGSGSYVMSFVLADQQGWLAADGAGAAPFEFVELATFDKLRAGVNGGAADAFMWEHFTSKKYWDNGEIKRIGEIFTPWASWKIVAREPAAPAVAEFLHKLNLGISYFNANKDEAVEYISTNLDYSADDARAWLSTVEFEADVTVPGIEDISKTIEILGKAGLLNTNEITAEQLIASL